MARLQLTPQKREFFSLYSDAAGNAVETAQLLCDLLAVFPADGDRLIAQIKEREHEGDRLTHEVIDLLNRTFVTPFDRDDMYRLAGALDDVSTTSTRPRTTSSTTASSRCRERAQQQADVILRATGSSARRSTCSKGSRTPASS